MKVADFFTSGIAPPDTSTENASAEITSHASHQTEVSSKAKKATVGKSKPPASTAVSSPPPASSMMTLNIRVEKPDIILVENMDDMDTNAIIFNVCTVKVKFNCFRKRPISSCMTVVHVY